VRYLKTAIISGASIYKLIIPSLTIQYTNASEYEKPVKAVI